MERRYTCRHLLASTWFLLLWTTYLWFHEGCSAVEVTLYAQSNFRGELASFRHIGSHVLSAAVARARSVRVSQDTIAAISSATAREDCDGQAGGKAECSFSCDKIPALGGGECICECIDPATVTARPGYLLLLPSSIARLDLDRVWLRSPYLHLASNAPGTRTSTGTLSRMSIAFI